MRAAAGPDTGHVLSTLLLWMAFCSALHAAQDRDPVQLRIVNAGGLDGIEATFSVAADCDTIWSVLLDYPNYDRIFEGNLRPPRVLSEDSGGATVEFWIDAKLAEVNYVLHRSYDEYCKRLSWRKVSGDAIPERIEGEWLILTGDTSGESVLVYRSFIKMTWWLPTSVSARLAKDATRGMAERLRTWIETLQ